MVRCRGCLRLLPPCFFLVSIMFGALIILSGQAHRGAVRRVPSGRSTEVRARPVPGISSPEARAVLASLLNTPADPEVDPQPIWADSSAGWFNESQTFARDGLGKHEPLFELTELKQMQLAAKNAALQKYVNSSHATAITPYPNLHIGQQSVLFNKSARDIIQRLTWPTLDVQFLKLGEDPLAAAQNPFLCAAVSCGRGQPCSHDPCATALKMAWQKLPDDCPGRLCDIPVVEGGILPSKIVKPPTIEDARKRLITVRMDMAEDCPERVDSSPYDAPTPHTSVPQRFPVSLRCFHFVVERKNEFKDSREFIRCHDAYAPGCLQPGDKLYLLLGMHVAIADRPEWTWATFWWTPSAVAITAGRATTSDLKGPWLHYSADVQQYPSRTMNLPHSNPYIEPPGELASNCIACHSRAVHRANPSLATDGDRTTASTQSKNGPLLGCYAPREQWPGQDNAYCREGNPSLYSPPTHFLWKLQEALAQRQQ